MLLRGNDPACRRDRRRYRDNIKVTGIWPEDLIGAEFSQARDETALKQAEALIAELRGKEIERLDLEKRRVEQANADLLDEIAERRWAEEALRHAKAAVEETSHELEAFSYSVAHDLRAPLRSIDGFSQALLDDCSGQLGDQGKTYLGYVRESAQRMAQLIDDLLSLSRVSRADLHRAPIDLSVLARKVFTNLQRDQPGRKVEFVTPETTTGRGDARLIGVVLENLIGNAWKFTSKLEYARIELGEVTKAGTSVYFMRLHLTSR